jgi:hypothetical protein
MMLFSILMKLVSKTALTNLTRWQRPTVTEMRPTEISSYIPYYIFRSVLVEDNCVLCRDVAGMFATLEPLHAMMDKGPQTLKETSFSQAYGNELNEAQKWCKRYKVSNNIRDLNQARILLYISVFEN